ncbi:MAG: hypothetical protein U0945_02810, partial [Flavobacterium sp.]|nr:hypothetical protein [Flavobacterium sp.]
MKNIKKLLTTAIIYILLCSENTAIFGAVTVVPGRTTAISGQSTNVRNSLFTSSSAKNSAQKTTSSKTSPTIYQRFQNLFNHSKTINKPVKAIPVRTSGLAFGQAPQAAKQPAAKKVLQEKE